MLILVGVTINVALNGGLFDKAREAAQKTERQIIYDQICTSIALSNSGIIDPKATESEALALLNAEGRTAVDMFADDEEEEEEVEPGEEEEEPEGSIKVIMVDDKYAYLITYARIIDITDYMPEFESMFSNEDLFEDISIADSYDLPKLTWADLGITNVVTNAEYETKDGEYMHYKVEFNEDPALGISRSIVVEHGALTAEVSNNLLLCLAMFTNIFPGDNSFLNNDETYYFYGDSVVIHNESVEQGAPTDLPMYLQE